MPRETSDAMHVAERPVELQSMWFSYFVTFANRKCCSRLTLRKRVRRSSPGRHPTDLALRDTAKLVRTLSTIFRMEDCSFALLKRFRKIMRLPGSNQTPPLTAAYDVVKNGVALGLLRDLAASGCAFCLVYQIEKPPNTNFRDQQCRAHQHDLFEQEV